MNKKNYLIVTGLAIALLLTVGYALFSQTINITGSAKAQGSFQITTTCTPGLTENVQGFVGGDGGENGYDHDSCTVQNNTVTYTTNLQYPGARRYFTIKMTNTGSIDAIFNENTGIVKRKNTYCMDGLDSSDLNNLTREKNGQFETIECIDLINANDEVLGVLSISLVADPSLGVILLEDSNGNVIDDTSDYYDSESGDIKLEPGMSLVIIVQNEFQSSWGDLKPGGQSSREFERFFLVQQEIQNEYIFNQPTAQ